MLLQIAQTKINGGYKMNKKIASFTIDHEKLLKELYVSRRDIVQGSVLTTFDIRI